MRAPDQASILGPEPGRRRRRGGGFAPGREDFELNLASIIDCLVVLIAFMLAATSFVSVGILNASVEVADVGAKGASESGPRVSVRLYPDRRIEVGAPGPGRSSWTLPAGREGRDGGWDFAALARRLAELKASRPEMGSVSLEPEGGVGYREVVRALEICRESFPGVTLGGT